MLLSRIIFPPKEPCGWFSYVKDGATLFVQSTIVSSLLIWIDGGMLSATIADFPQYIAQIIWVSS